jgi:hypothetical protein
MTFHEQETFRLIRDHDKRFLVMDDHTLQGLYRDWSIENARANWITPTPRAIEAFCHWAHTTPFDEAMEETESWT